MSLKIGLVGAGHMGRIHLQKLAFMEGVRVAAVVDSDEKLAGKCAEEFGLPFYAEWTSMPEDTDGVVIATPTEMHYDIAKTFLGKGVHVFIEKPITSEPDQASELIEIADKAGLILQVGHLERLNPAFRKALCFIRNPLYIQVDRLSMFTGRSIDIDVVLDLMIHDIDLVLSLVHSDILELRASGMPFLIDKLDAVNARIEFRNGCVANLNASRISVKKERTITVFEKDRYFLIDLLQGKLTICSRGDAGTCEIEELPEERGDAVRQELAEFVESIQSGGSPSVQGRDGLKALVVANQITRYIIEKDHHKPSP
jgi:predicted dehydrogenase